MGNIVITTASIAAFGTYLVLTSGLGHALATVAFCSVLAIAAYQSGHGDGEVEGYDIGYDSGWADGFDCWSEEDEEPAWVVFDATLRCWFWHHGEDCDVTGGPFDSREDAERHARENGYRIES